MCERLNFRNARPWGVMVASCLLAAAISGETWGQFDPAQFLAGERLTWEDDIASRMVDGIDRFLLRKLSESAALRERHWQRDLSSSENYGRSIEPNRQRLTKILGMVEPRVSPVSMHCQPLASAPGLNPLQSLAKSQTPPHSEIDFSFVRWPVLEDPDPQRALVSVWGEGLLIAPRTGIQSVADVLLIPDCDQTLRSFLDESDQLGCTRLARQLVAQNCRVLVPLTISRQLQQRGGRSVLTDREFIYRTSYVLGRHLLGYETQKVLAGIDWFCSQRPITVPHGEIAVSRRPLIVIGAGEGGRIGLLAAALDERIDGLCISGGFGSYESMWQEPIDRNVFGFLDQFGGAELLSMVAPRPVWIDHRTLPRQELLSQAGGAPGVVEPILPADGQAEVERTRQLLRPWCDRGEWAVTETVPTISEATDGKATSATLDDQLLKVFITQCSVLAGLQRFVETKAQLVDAVSSEATIAAGEMVRSVLLPASSSLDLLDEVALQRRAVEELDRHNQLVLRELPFVRDAFMQEINTDSLEAYAASIEAYRDSFRDEVVGAFDQQLLAPQPRFGKSWDNPKWTGTEVVLDVFPDVIAYGVLLLPKNLKAGQRRPVVVCQHGLEGRPTDTFLGDHAAYHNFAASLAEQGYIVFAPQNPYLFGDRFRSLQRKANPLGKTLFSVIVPQHQQIVNWLKTLPCVDEGRVAFYGLSYGGKSAMRIPALVTDYCLSICSADFNEWVVKCASTRDNFSYVWTNEYEIFEWNLGSTFNYAEMAALICPRPFMVERGHFDGVGTDAWVAFEYAKVRNLYAARLKIPERTQIEWFDGPHTIHARGTFAFLSEHLNWPEGSMQE